MNLTRDRVFLVFGHAAIVTIARDTVVTALFLSITGTRHGPYRNVQLDRALFPVLLAELDFLALELRKFLLNGPHEGLMLRNAYLSAFHHRPQCWLARVVILFN
jgi:hypothetical protein